MILYRALNNDDKLNLYKNGIVTSSLINSQDEVGKLPEKICKNIDNKYMLNFLYGRINDNSMNKKKSPWISTTSDFFTAYNYARLYKCKGINYERRSILCFEIDDNLLINNIEELCYKNIKSGSVLNLSENNLSVYYANGSILSNNRINDNITILKSSPVVKTYSASDSEYLIALYIKTNKYLLLDPITQDKLLHKYGEDITEYINRTLCQEEHETSNNRSSLQLVKKMI